VKQNAYLMPKDDRWVIQTLLSVTVKRLNSEHEDHADVRRALLRFLFALQGLPRFTDGINLSIEIDNYQLTFSDEEVGIHKFTSDGHEVFRLQYFEGSHHCIDGYNILTGAEKEHTLKYHLDQIVSLMTNEAALLVEDYSQGENVDRPAIDPIWEPEQESVFLVTKAGLNE